MFYFSEKKLLSFAYWSNVVPNMYPAILAITSEVKIEAWKRKSKIYGPNPHLTRREFDPSNLCVV